ncbi:MAG: TRAM domain-containing protein [Gordonia sp. (in: high G+C Gram-positive bacteria)]|uniref:class I SAM-dependent RNA methyltransferase n=1 Tax=Gordonia sp. (in: high G+C Gram-positive bacteria) TaxID=84139 RepID=UPI0039E603B4
MTPPTLTCDVESLAHGGAGVARVEGRVVFVDGALPGETVRAEITDQRRDSLWRARTVEVLVPSPDRTPVSCRAAAAGAGCCDLAYATPGAIRRAKTTVLADTLTRIGRITPPEALAVEPIGDGAGHRWRIRARLGVGTDGAPGFRAVGSNAVVDEPCAALTPELSAAVARLDRGGLRPGAELIAVHDDDGAVHLAETAPVEHARRRAGGGGSRAAAQRRRAASGRGQQRTLVGAERAVYRVGDRAWELPIDAFWQAHRGAADAYARVAAGWLAPVVTGGTVWDLYGGAGVFAGAALDGGAEAVHVVDTEPPALAAAAAVFGADRVHTHRGAVAPKLLAALPAPTAVILDPPRSGAGTEVMDAVVAAAPSAIVHVGCDPAAFARDLGRAAAAGYEPAEIRGFDAFPLTHHVEAMALLVRG